MSQLHPTARQVLDPLETRSDLKCDTHKLETDISSFVENVKMSVYVPRYATYHIPIVATGRKGRARGELNYPRGVVIHEETHQIFVANDDNHRVEIFTETGEFISQLGVGQLSEPWGIAIHGDNVYISCEDHTISKFSLVEMCRVRRIGGNGSNNGQFIYPRQLTTDAIGRIFIADLGNNRICIRDTDIHHLRNITHQSMSHPYDVKVSQDRLYVLCPDNNPCMHVLSLDGDKLHSLITRGEGMDVLYPRFFCPDSLDNFVLSDNSTDSFPVFSQEDNLLHTIGKIQPGMFLYPHGVAITPNRRLVCVSWNSNYGLQILY